VYIRKANTAFATTELNVNLMYSDKTDHSLDPRDWDDFRRLGHQIIDDLVDEWRTIRERPVWRPVPEEVKMRLREPLPLEGQGAKAAYSDFLRDVSPYPRGNCHPRFWGWVSGSGLPIGVLADLLASGMNSSVGAFESAVTMVEEQVLDWLKQALDLPTESSAVLTSGCSMSNLVGLAVARHVKMWIDVKNDGMFGANSRPILYTSCEGHSSVQKAVELLGFGNASLRRVPVDDQFRVDPASLLRMIRADRASGHTPICVIGNAGTVGTGAVDPLDSLADICGSERLWFHVDGAFGTFGWLTERARPLLSGMQRADSLAFDLHKWMFLPFDIGCVIIRDQLAHKAALATTGPYWTKISGSGSDPVDFPNLGIELTRRFRALKIWLAIKAHGLNGFSRAISMNMDQAFRLRKRLSAMPDFETMPGSINVVCFRFCPPGTPEIDHLNKELLRRLQRGGKSFVSHTWLNGHFMIRLAITNHRTTQDDVDAFCEEVVALAQALPGHSLTRAAPGDE
jgi:aromatic-L-amino-acid decarboxylase